MTLSTAFTRLFDIQHPIVLAPMGGSAGGALAAAVSNGGGLGLPPLPVWASQAIDLINDLPPAADLVGVLAAQAEDMLARAGKTD